MALDKIRITWDEVRSPQVDAKLKQQEAITRVQEHYIQMAPLPITSTLPNTDNWRGTIVSLAFFGLVGGLLGWIPGEVAWKWGKGNLEDFHRLNGNAAALEEKLQSRRISQTDYDQARRKLEQQGQDNPFFKIAADPSLSDAEKVRRMNVLAAQDKLRRFLGSMLLFTCAGMGIALCLSIAEPAMAQNGRAAIINGSIGITLGLVGGVVVSLFIDTLYHKLGGGQLGSFSWLQQVFARTLGYGVLGLFLSAAPGLALRSGKKLAIGLAGGLAGGLMGGLCFDLIGVMTQQGWLSRLVALAAIGGLSGAATGLIENVAKTGWVRVTAGLIAGKQFVLYRNPTLIGSSPKCEIYLFKDRQVSPRHATIHLLPGHFELEDLDSTSGTFVNGQPIQRTRLRHGDQVQIGATVFRFQERAGTGA